LLQACLLFPFLSALILRLPFAHHNNPII
jgi:hypothetical protein